MTQRLLTCFVWIIWFAMSPLWVIAASQASPHTTITTVNEIHQQTETGMVAIPVVPIAHSTPALSKVQAPLMEELPHLYKFHKERVRRIKKHHSKYWLLTQVLLVLCHLSILLIAYLHASH